MSIKKNTNYGNINISLEVLASIASQALSECYGIVGMASKNLIKDKYYEILKRDNVSKGIRLNLKKGLEIDVYVVASYGVKISEVLLEAQKRVKYDIEKKLDITVDRVNIYVQGVK